MKSIHNEHGSVIVFVTLMIVLLLIMVGIGLDTGQLTQPEAKVRQPSTRLRSPRFLDCPRDQIRK